MASTTSINNELYSALVTQAQFAAYENSIARQLVTVFDAPLNTGKTLQVPVWAAVSATAEYNSGLTEGTAPSSLSTNTTSAVITLGEHIVYHQVTDLLRDSAYNDVFSQLGDMSGRAIAESMDTEVFSYFAPNAATTLSGNVGTDGGTVTTQTILQAAATLRSRKLTGPFYAVIHPGQAYALKANLTATTSYSAISNVGNAVLDGFYIGQIAGVSIFESALVPGNASNAYGAVFAPQALGHAMRGGIEMNTLYLPATRATDVVMKATAGAQILNTTFGVRVLGAKSIP
jgi:N4-gp56 family major capsid protein